MNYKLDFRDVKVKCDPGCWIHRLGRATEYKTLWDPVSGGRYPGDGDQNGVVNKKDGVTPHGEGKS